MRRELVSRACRLRKPRHTEERKKGVIKSGIADGEMRAAESLWDVFHSLNPYSTFDHTREKTCALYSKAAGTARCLARDLKS
jgi:hypothetical protein